MGLAIASIYYGLNGDRFGHAEQVNDAIDVTLRIMLDGGDVE